MRCRLKSSAFRLFTQPFVQAQIKEKINTLRHWPLWGEFTSDRCGGCPAQRSSNAENGSVSWSHHDALFGKWLCSLNLFNTTCCSFARSHEKQNYECSFKTCIIHETVMRRESYCRQFLKLADTLHNAELLPEANDNACFLRRRHMQNGNVKTLYVFCLHVSSWIKWR